MDISIQDAENIVHEMKQAIHRDINIMDERGVILASTNAARRGTVHRGAAAVLREGLERLEIWEDDPAQGVQRGINLPIILDGKPQGVIGVTGDPEEVSVFGKVIQRLTEIMLESIRQRQQLYEMDRARSLFLENWLFENKVDWAEMETRGRLLDFDLRASYTAAVLTIREERDRVRELRDQEILSHVRRRLQDCPHSHCAILRDQIVVLLCDLDRGETETRVRRIVEDIGSFFNLEISAGLSDRSRSPADVRRRYMEAVTASRVAEQHPGRRVVSYDQVSLEFILENIPPAVRSDLAAGVFSACSEEERREFRETVLLYFRENGSIRRCADAIFVHRNTFQYRMERLRKKTGYDLRLPRDAAVLYIAIQQA